MAVAGRAGGGGFRRVQLISLDSNSLPAFSGTPGATGYMHTQLNVAKAFTPTFPDPIIISHTGDDGVAGQIMLPANETIAGEIRTGHTNLEADALLQNISVVTLGDQKYIGRGIVPQEFAQVGMYCYRQAVDTDPGSATKGAERWLYYAIPIAKIAPQSGSMEEGGEDENAYNCLPQTVSRHLWGIDFVVGTDGFGQAQLIHGIAAGPPVLEVWEIDATPTLILDLGVNAKADLAATGYAVNVFHNDIGTGIIDVTSQCTFGTGDEIDASAVAPAPVAGDFVYAWYEALAVPA